MEEFCMHEIKKEIRYEKLTPGFSIPLETSFDESRTQKNARVQFIYLCIAITVSHEESRSRKRKS